MQLSPILPLTQCGGGVNVKGMDLPWLWELLRDHFSGILLAALLAWGIWTGHGMRKVKKETLTAVKEEISESEKRIEALFDRKGYTLNSPRGFNPAKYEQLALERGRDQIKDEMIRELRKDIESIVLREVGEAIARARGQPGSDEA